MAELMNSAEMGCTMPSRCTSRTRGGAVDAVCAAAERAATQPSTASNAQAANARHRKEFLLASGTAGIEVLSQRDGSRVAGVERKGGRDLCLRVFQLVLRGIYAGQQHVSLGGRLPLLGARGRLGRLVQLAQPQVQVAQHAVSAG